MDNSYNFETIKFKKSWIYIEDYLNYCKRLSNMFKYKKINEELYNKCHLDAFVKLQKSYFGS